MKTVEPFVLPLFDATSLLAQMLRTPWDKLPVQNTVLFVKMGNLLYKVALSAKWVGPSTVGLVVKINSCRDDQPLRLPVMILIDALLRLILKDGGKRPQEAGGVRPGVVLVRVTGSRRTIPVRSS